MKKIFFIIIILGTCLSRSVAQSMLKVRTANSMRINVMLDGRYFNKTGTSVTVGDLPPGRHRLKIFTIAETRRGRGYEEVIYDGKVRTEVGMITMLVYDPNTDQVDIQAQDINSYLNEHPIPDANAPQNNDVGNESNNSISDNNNSAPPASPAAISTLTSGKTDQLKVKVTAKKTDTEKMSLLKDELKNETLTISQVSDIMDWFSFEETKLLFAEWAYTYTVDTEYFTDLESKFTYKNYQDELDKFIKGKK
jgi:hypothetical protein